MWLTLLVLFVALCPGILFTVPLGKKMGGKLTTAAVHALIFIIVVNLLYVSLEGFAPLPPGRNYSINGWTLTSTPPQDPVTLLAYWQANLKEAEEGVHSAQNDLAQAQNNLAQFEPPGSRIRQKCMSVQNTSCPSADGQLRLFGSTDCEALGGGYNMNGECNGYSLPCAKILNNIRAGPNQNEKCIAARTLLASAPKTGKRLYSLMDPTAGPAPTSSAVKTTSSSIVSTISDAIGLGSYTPSQQISMLGGNGPIQAMPPSTCPSGKYPLMYNGINDGTGSNTYTTLCTPCTTKYPGNSKIPSNIDAQTKLNYSTFCSSSGNGAGVYVNVASVYGAGV